MKKIEELYNKKEYRYFLPLPPHNDLSIVEHCVINSERAEECSRVVATERYFKSITSWSKVKKGKKPLGWWYHKIMCEIAWSLRNYFNGITWKYYYSHLNIMVNKYKFNLYGEEWL